MILDTDFLIALLRKQPDSIQFLENLINDGSNLRISHVNLWELYQGVFSSQKIQQNLDDMEELISFFDILEFTKTSDKRFGMVMSELKKQGKPIGVMDTILASLALEHDEPIITRNVKHFNETNVSIKEW